MRNGDWLVLLLTNASSSVEKGIADSDAPGTMLRRGSEPSAKTSLEPPPHQIPVQYMIYNSTLIQYVGVDLH